jgi:hypothetical protein
MAIFPVKIPTADLQLSDMPDQSASWSTIGRFALSFVPSEYDPYHLANQDLSALSIDCSLAQLRSHLFLEQRRWNHFGREPDPEDMVAIRRVLGLIRDKLSSKHGA